MNREMARDEYEDMRGEIERLRAALEIYAKEKNWMEEHDEWGRAMDWWVWQLDGNPMLIAQKALGKEE